MNYSLPAESIAYSNLISMAAKGNIAPSQTGDLTSSDVRRVSEALLSLYDPSSVVDFPTRVMAVVRKLTPCDFVSYDEVDLRSGTAIDRTDRETLLTREDLLARWQVYSKDHPVIQYMGQGGDKQVHDLSDFWSRRQYHKKGLYHEFYKPLGIEHQLGLMLPDMDLVTGLSINRNATPFSSRERTLLELIAPHVLQAYYLHRTLEKVAASPKWHASSDLIESLSKREREVYAWLSQGKRDSEIAMILEISKRTVEKHVSRILAKLGVETRTAAVSLGIVG